MKHIITIDCELVYCSECHLVPEIKQSINHYATTETIHHAADWYDINSEPWSEDIGVSHAHNVFSVVCPKCSKKISIDERDCTDYDLARLWNDKNKITILIDMYKVYTFKEIEYLFEKNYINKARRDPWRKTTEDISYKWFGGLSRKLRKEDMTEKRDWIITEKKVDSFQSIHLFDETVRRYYKTG